MRSEQSCGFIIYRVNNGIKEYLIVKDRNDNYCFPKGHIDNDESLLECAYREVYEEVGIKNIKLIDNYQYNLEYVVHNDYLKKVTLFLGESNDVPFINDGEIKEMNYLDYESAYSRITHNEYKMALKEAKNK